MGSSGTTLLVTSGEHPEHPSLTLGSPSYHARSVIVCEDSDQLINLIASQEGVDVSDEAEEGTNAVDVDSLPHLPELSAPQAPARPAAGQAGGRLPPQRPQFQPQPQRVPPPRPARPQPQQRPSSPFSNLFGNFRLPFF